MSDTLYIFTDASYSPQTGVGIGAYYVTNDITPYTQLSIKDIKAAIGTHIQYLYLDNVQGGCTNIEMHTINHVLGLTCDWQKERMNYKHIKLYTDCQKASGNQNCLKSVPGTSIDVIKVKGHSKQANRDKEEKIFDVVDKMARKELRMIVC